MRCMFGHRNKPTVVSVEASWTIARAVDDGKPLLIGVNIAFRDAVDRDRYPIRIGVALPLNTPDDQGWPSSAEGHELQAAEDRIIDALNGRAILVGRITGRSMREFIFHASDHDWIGDFHSEVQASVTSHEVQVMAQTDPGWTVYQQLLPDV